jgi:ChaB/Rho termination factor, N-terminal domain
MPARKEMPSTIRRSWSKAQRTWAKVHDSAVETYGEGERAHRTAYDALKHSFERKGDRWVAKRQKGPSDPGAESGGPNQSKPTYGGVDARGNTKEELYRRAKKLGVEGRSRMNKDELARAIARKQR